MRFTTLVLAFTLIAPASAFAESAVPLCTAGSFYPGGPNIPANLPGFLFISDYSLGRGAPSEALSLTRHSGDSSVPVTFEIVDREHGWFIVPSSPLEEGATYVFSDTSCTDWSGTKETTFFIDPSVSLPDALGVTIVSDVTSSRRGPYEQLSYRASVRLEIAPEATAFADSLGMTLEIDGEPWSIYGPVPLHEREHSIAVQCRAAFERLDEGAHTFQHRAGYFGQEASLSTDPVTEEIRCRDAVRVDPDDGHRLTPAEIADADRLPDGSMSPPEGTSPPLPEMMSGCSVVPGGPPAGGLAFLALVLVWSRRRLRAAR